MFENEIKKIKDTIKQIKRNNLPGNKSKYGLNTVEKIDSPISGKNIIFLGSSVTYGAASKAVSFVDYLEKIYNFKVVKEAVSGTTLVDETNRHGDSCVTRMKKIDASFKADLFVCQLSTNDATKNKPLGEISESFNKDDFDCLTIIGAIEYIICYIKEVYNCPIIFYTGTKYESQLYGHMVDALYKIKEKWNISILDLWNDEKLNDVSKETYSLYMADPIHPTQAGYKLWWLPKFVEMINDVLNSETCESVY